MNVSCDKCADTFPSRNKLFRHVRLFHGEEVTSSSCTELLSDNREVEDVLEEDTQRDVRLYVIGGRHRNKTLASTEYYSFREKRWIEGPALNEHRGSHGSVSLSDGTLYALSGGGMHSNLVSCERLVTDTKRLGDDSSTTTPTWKGVASMSIERHALAVCRLSGYGKCDGLIFATGGWKDGKECSTDVEMYSDARNEWTILPKMNVGRRLLGAVSVLKNNSSSSDYSLYVFGGQIDNSNHLGFEEGAVPNGWVTGAVERFDSQQNTWTRMKDMPIKGMTSAICVKNSFIYVIVHGAAVYRYFTDRDDYIRVATLPLPHWYCFDVCAFGSKIFFTGGSVNGRWSTAFWEFNTDTMAFSENETMSKERRRCSNAIVTV
jgi:hypothetical protein